MAEEAILGFLNSNGAIPDSHQFAASAGIDHAELENVIRSLHGFRLIDAIDFKKERWVLTDEGKNYASEGSPEVQFFLAVPPHGTISREELEKKLGANVCKIGSSYAVKNKWVEFMKKDVSRKVAFFLSSSVEI